MADSPSVSEAFGTFETLSERLDNLDGHVVDVLAGAAGEWQQIVPSLQEAIDGDLFPCFVGTGQEEVFGRDLSIRTRGTGQAEMMGVVIYVTGPDLPADLAVPPATAECGTIPAEMFPTESRIVVPNASIGFRDPNAANPVNLGYIFEGALVLGAQTSPAVAVQSVTWDVWV